MRWRMATIKGHRAVVRSFARRSVSLNAALRIIARGELTEVGAAWRRVAEGHLPPIGNALDLSPHVEIEAIRWTARRRRLLEAFGLGGGLVRRLNARVPPPNPTTRRSPWFVVGEALTRLSHKYRAEAALFEAAGLHLLPCYARRSPHWYMGPGTRRRSYCRRHRHAAYQRTYRQSHDVRSGRVRGPNRRSV